MLLPFWTRSRNWPLVLSWKYPCFWYGFPSESSTGESSKRFTVMNNSSSSTYTAASHFVCTSPLAAITTTGVLKNSQSLQFWTVCPLFAQHMHWCSGIYHKFSFLRICVRDGAGMKVAFFRSLVLQDTSGRYSHLRGRMALAFFVSSWDLSSTFGAYGLRSWGVVVVIPSDWPFFFPNLNLT